MKLNICILFVSIRCALAANDNGGFEHRFARRSSFPTSRRALSESSSHQLSIRPAEAAPVDSTRTPPYEIPGLPADYQHRHTFEQPPPRNNQLESALPPEERRGLEAARKAWSSNRQTELSRQNLAALKAQSIPNSAQQAKPPARIEPGPSEANVARPPARIESGPSEAQAPKPPPRIESGPSAFSRVRPAHENTNVARPPPGHEPGTSAFSRVRPAKRKRS